MAFHDILYTVDRGVAVITLNRPSVRNAQSYRLLDEVDAAFTAAAKDRDVKVVVVRGSDGHFSAGHDLVAPEQADRRSGPDPTGGFGWYDDFKAYNLDLLLKWRAFPKPTIAMVEGYCIYGGWMLAAAMDLVFAASDAQFLGGLMEYMSIPWDIGVRRAKELSFECRFISAAEAYEYGFLNRVLPPAELEAETFGYAQRVAENSALFLRVAKQSINRAQDAQGFTNAVEGGLTEFVAMVNIPGQDAMRLDSSGRRLEVVNLALRGRRGERPGQTLRAPKG